MNERKLYVGVNQMGNEVIYVETPDRAFRYNPDNKLFVDCTHSFEKLKNVFNLEMKRVLHDGEKVSDLVHYRINIT